MKKNLNTFVQQSSHVEKLQKQLAKTHEAKGTKVNLGIAPVKEAETMVKDLRAVYNLAIKQLLKEHYPQYDKLTTKTQ